MAVLWGLIGPVARFALAEGVSPLEIAFWRALIAGALYLVHSRARRAGRVSGRDLPAILGFGLTGVAFFYASYLLAVQAGGAALAAVLLYTAPVWVAAGAWLLFRERLDRQTLFALLIAIAGVSLVAFAGGGGARFSLAAIAWGLGAGAAYALYYLAGKRYFGVYGTETVLAYALPVGALALLPLVAFAHKSVLAWTVILFLTLVPTYLAYLIYGAGLQRVAPTRAATVASLEPVVAALAAFLLWDERLGRWGYMGAAMMLLAVMLIATKEPPPRAEATPR